MTFDDAFDRLLGHEGGYVNDPRDPGGETNWGVSKRAYPNVDIKNLTREQAKTIYKRDYWDKVRADEYHGAIGFQLFDVAVNSGLGNAARILQRAIGVRDDGKVGPITVAAINAMPVPALLMKFNAERLWFYTDLSTFKAFGKGWSRRIADNLRFGAEDADG